MCCVFIQHASMTHQLGMLVQAVLAKAAGFWLLCWLFAGLRHQDTSIGAWMLQAQWQLCMF